MKKQYSTEQKAKIISKYLSGVAISQLANDVGVSRSTLYKWIAKSDECQKQERKVNMRDFFGLKQKCDQQEQMIEILQAAPCTVNAPLSERYDYITECSEKYSVTLLCKTMKVAKGSYYNHTLRNKNKDTVYAKKKKELTPVIEEIYQNNNQIFGSSKIQAILKDRGYSVSQNTVAEIMHENGWFAIGTSSKKLYYANLERKENILKQQFQVSRPNEVWVSDVTYFKYNQTTYYICVVIDLFARKVVAFKISLTNSTQLTKGKFKSAYDRWLPTDLLFHSDQGTNYTSGTFRLYLISCGMKQSFSKHGTPFHNSVMESFFKSMKTEKLYRTDFRSEREFRNAVREVHRLLQR